MILFALLAPALMMAFLFGMAAFEDLLFLRPAATDDVSPSDDTARSADPEESASPTGAAVDAGDHWVEPPALG
ncbi:hypothetical protein AB0N87_13010 [Streptomyces sp. NPDC093228]|uniref:hypothetical protein n=1 Tax=unclassified Streptomyces TaxID=2593676 RepID=UPI000741088B|nr:MULTISPECIES: hypothetical protein [unclassified Streptomyces]KUJ58178.1 hypothetical protein ADL25_04600 [Streptomyces sp. NRRL F-5122]MDX3258388.1 hypothetical protein [Streptomyces sp. MI02-2A]REE58207.1 hypothetical protein BX257_0621 [Streptomyces sp. 3212.3]